MLCLPAWTKYIKNSGSKKKQRASVYIASCWYCNWPFEAIFSQDHFSQAIHNIGRMDSDFMANILAKDFSLSFKTLQIMILNFWYDQKNNLVYCFQTLSCSSDTWNVAVIYHRALDSCSFAWIDWPIRFFLQQCDPLLNWTSYDFLFSFEISRHGTLQKMSVLIIDSIGIVD